MLVMVCGLPGTGKSTVAKRISKDLGAVILRTDVIRSEMFQDGSMEDVLKSGTPEKFNLVWSFNLVKDIPDKYREIIEQQRDMVYTEMIKRVDNYLNHGKNIVLDGTFSSLALRKRFYDIAGKSDSKVFLVKCICSEEFLKKRFGRRKKRADDASNVDKMEIYYYMKESYEEPDPAEAFMIVCDSGMRTMDIASGDTSDSDFEKVISSVRGLVDDFNR